MEPGWPNPGGVNLLVVTAPARFAPWHQGISRQLVGRVLNISTINQCLHEAGRAAEPVVERDILPLIRAAE